MEKQLLEAGQIVNCHGIHGEVKIQPWADTPEFLLQFDTVYLDSQAYHVQSSRVQKTCVLMKLAGIDSIEQAAKLRLKTVRIDRSSVQLEHGAVFIADLIGCTCVTEDGQPLGKIFDVWSLPANDVYLVRGAHEYRIPAVKEFIRNIDLDGKTVTVHMIEGLKSDEN